MRYISTRDGKQCVSAAQAIVRGISPEGGLYAPVSFPQLSMSEIQAMAGAPYADRSARVLRGFLTEFADDDIRAMCESAYASFDAPEVVPVRPLSNDRHILELFHGPTHAFKDVALQLLPHLMTASARECGEEREILILVATSGDTGKAALSGFAGARGVRICVFYPEGGVSEVQRLQMATQRGENTRVVAVRGNFDDAQSGVKRIFTDPAMIKGLNEKGIVLSSANSINLGRLIPQIAYYFSAYVDLLESGAIAPGDKVNFCVPTGNFGNILAAAYAKNMGLPVNKLICASNRNHILSDFINTGVYDRNRAFHLTTSPSMDILISSNLERMLFEISGRDAEKVSSWMKSLKEAGRYQVEGEALEKLTSLLWGGWATEDEVIGEISRTWAEDHYLLDPHTAVAVRVLRKYRDETGDRTQTIVASTASPFKFGRAVAAALYGESQVSTLDDFGCCALLGVRTGRKVPESISGLRNEPVRHTAISDIETMADYLLW